MAFTQPEKAVCFLEFAKTKSQDDGVVMPWPPKSKDLTPCDFFLWEFVKDWFMCHPFQKVDELKALLTEAVATIDKAMLERVWRESDNRLDVCP